MGICPVAFLNPQMRYTESFVVSFVYLGIEESDGAGTHLIDW